jgi:hypothetical protein
MPCLGCEDSVQAELSVLLHSHYVKADHEQIGLLTQTANVRLRQLKEREDWPNLDL